MPAFWLAFFPSMIGKVTLVISFEFAVVWTYTENQLEKDTFCLRKVAEFKILSQHLSYTFSLFDVYLISFKSGRHFVKSLLELFNLACKPPFFLFAMLEKWVRNLLVYCCTALDGRARLISLITSLIDVCLEEQLEVCFMYGNLS